MFQLPQQENIVPTYAVPAELSARFRAQPLAVEVAPEIDRGPRTLDAALRSTWGQLENEGLTGYVKLKDTDGTPASIRSRGRDMAEHYNAQARLARRQQARTDREDADRQETEQPLTLEEWNAYTPLQQAAAQANADLAAAIRKDIENQSQHRATGEQLETYQSRVDELFGGRTSGFGGIEYAPNTIAFLDERNIKAADLAGKSLDDFISGDVLMSRAEVDALGQDRKGARGRNISLAERLSQGQLAYQERIARTLQRGDKLLSQMTGSASAVAAESSYGARYDPEQAAPTDRMQPIVREHIDAYMEVLARPDSPIDQALQIIATDLSEKGASQEEADQVWQNLIERSRQATTGEGLWFPDVDVPMRPPAEVAEALGAPTLKRQATSSEAGR